MLTIVIPTFKRPHLLSRAIESVLTQKESKFTLLIVDNYSQDETFNIVKNYRSRDSRVKYLENREYIGAAENFKFGLDAVRTSLVSFLSDDDYLSPDFLKDCLKWFTVHPDIAFVGGGGCYVNEEGTVKPFSGNAPIDGYYASPKGYFAYVNSMFYPVFGALIFKTEIIKKIGVDTRIKTGLDQDIIGRCAATYPVYFLCTKNYYFFFENPNSLSKHQDPTLHENDARILHENLCRLNWSYEDRKWLDCFFKERLIKIFSGAFKSYLSKREFGFACHYAKKTRNISRNMKSLGWVYQTQIFRFCPPLLKLYEWLKEKEREIRKSMR